MPVPLDRLAVLTLAAVLLGGCGARDDRRPVRVYAAASLTDALEALADTFQTTSPGGEVALNVAGSSLLARQLERGAVADLYISAHPSWTDYLLDRGRIQPAVRLPISNRLVEIRRRRAPDDPGGTRLALADPAHVPAGIYAQEALTCDGRWEEVRDSVVPTLDVRAAMAAVQTGSVASAIVYASDALFAPELEVRDAVSEPCQPTIQYTAARVETGTQSRQAARFLELIRDARMAPLWRRYGFSFHEAR